MKYQKIISIKIKRFHKKKWVIVEFENHTFWMPEILDLGIIVSFIGMCEDEKYPGGKGYKYTRDFISRCFDRYPFAIRRIYRQSYDPNNLKKLKVKQ